MSLSRAPGISRWFFTSLATIIVLLVHAPGVAAFTNDQIAREAEQFERYLRQSWKIEEGATAQYYRDRGDTARKNNNPRAATGAYASATVLENGNAATWLALSRAYSAIEPANYSERTNFGRNATSSAWLAYQRADAEPVKAAALAQLGKALAARSLWRPAIDAYAASLDVQRSAGRARRL